MHVPIPLNAVQTIVIQMVCVLISSQTEALVLSPLTVKLDLIACQTNAKQHVLNQATVKVLGIMKTMFIKTNASGPIVPLVRLLVPNPRVVQHLVVSMILEPTHAETKTVKTIPIRQNVIINKVSVPILLMVELQVVEKQSVVIMTINQVVMETVDVVIAMECAIRNVQLHRTVINMTLKRYVGADIVRIVLIWIRLHAVQHRNVITNQTVVVFLSSVIKTPIAIQVNTVTKVNAISVMLILMKRIVMPKKNVNMTRWQHGQNVRSKMDSIVLVAAIVNRTIVQETCVWVPPRPNKNLNLYKLFNFIKMIFLLLLTSASALSVLDTYDIQGIPEYAPNISIPTKDPYYGNISTFELHNSKIHIPVYALDGKLIRYVNEVYVECYTDNDCDYVLTQKDIQYLSLYASFIEAHSPLSTSYALGLLRNKNNQNIMGMYTLDYHVLNNYIGFWVRLERYGSHVYNDKVSYARTLSLLELAIHERSHHDAPTYNANMAHCDEFQVNYNSLIQYAANDIDKYNALSESILHGIEPEEEFPVWVPILSASLVIISIGICWLRSRYDID